MDRSGGPRFDSDDDRAEFDRLLDAIERCDHAHESRTYTGVAPRTYDPDPAPTGEHWSSRRPDESRQRWLWRLEHRLDGRTFDERAVPTPAATAVSGPTTEADDWLALASAVRTYLDTMGALPPNLTRIGLDVHGQLAPTQNGACYAAPGGMCTVLVKGGRPARDVRATTLHEIQHASDVLTYGAALLDADRRCSRAQSLAIRSAARVTGFMIHRVDQAR